MTTVAVVCLRLPLCERDHWHGFVPFGVSQAGGDGIAFCGDLRDLSFGAVVAVTWKPLHWISVPVCSPGKSSCQQSVPAGSQWVTQGV